MLTLVLIFGLLNSMCMVEAYSQLRIESVDLLKADEDFVDRSWTRIIVNTTSNTLKIEILLLQEFPRNVTFDMQLIEHMPSDVFVDLGKYSSQMCNISDQSNINLPNFVLELTKGGRCGGEGMFIFEDAGLYQITTLQRIYRKDYPITSSNEIASGNRTILKYDILFNAQDKNKVTDSPNFQVTWVGKRQKNDS